MRKVIVTNNEKVRKEIKADDDIQVMLVDGTPIDVFEQTRNVINTGGRVYVDPETLKLTSYYRSVPLLMSEDGNAALSIDIIDGCIKKLESKKHIFEKEPVMAVKCQDKDMKVLLKKM